MERLCFFKERYGYASTAILEESRAIFIWQQVHESVSCSHYPSFIQHAYAFSGTFMTLQSTSHSTTTNWNGRILKGRSATIWTERA